MVKKIWLLMGIILLTGCDTKLQHLSMKKTPYSGNELRIDGYYYSNPDPDILGRIYVAVFYQDGFCIYTQGSPENTDILSYIENEILLNDAYINKLKREPIHIGAFQIMNPDIEIEYWAFRSAPFRCYGEIIDGTTFTINKVIENKSGKTHVKNLTFQFQQFDQKPDNTNNYVKSVVLD